MPGRNDPCPCGSGRKYKRCCMEKDREEAPGLTLPPDVRREALEATTWEADILPIPGIRPDEPNAGAVVSLVVASGIVVQSDIFGLEVHEDEEIAEVIEEKIMEAGRTLGSLPEHVRVAYQAVAEHLLPRLATRGVESVEAEPFLYLSHAAASLFEELDGGGIWPPVGLRETWRAWGRTDEEIGRLFRAASSYFRSAPWTALDGDRPLVAVMPEDRRWVCSVLGQAGQEFGLGLYSEMDDFLDLLELDEEWFPDTREGRSYGLLFDNRGGLPPKMQREVASKGWEVASPEAYPSLWSMGSPGGAMCRADWDDMVTLLESIPRFTSELEAPATDETGVVWEDEETGVSFLLLPWGAGLEVLEPMHLSPGGPKGPAADPEASLRTVPWHGDDEAEGEMLAEFGDWLYARGLSDATVTKHVKNADELFYFLREDSGVPLEAIHEYDLRNFLHDWVPRKSGLGVTRIESIPVSLGHFFDFLAYRKGLLLDWGKDVLADRDYYRDRVGRCPRGGFWDASTREWLQELTLDLYAGVLLPDARLGEDEEWGATMGVKEWKLHQELQRRWLIWREELIGEGLTSPGPLRSELEVRQREWETRPHPDHDGRTPVELIREERKETGSMPPFPWGS